MSWGPKCIKHVVHMLIRWCSHTFTSTLQRNLQSRLQTLCLFHSPFGEKSSKRRKVQKALLSLRERQPWIREDNGGSLKAVERARKEAGFAGGISLHGWDQTSDILLCIMWSKATSRDLICQLMVACVVVSFCVSSACLLTGCIALLWPPLSPLELVCAVPSIPALLLRYKHSGFPPTFPHISPQLQWLSSDPCFSLLRRPWAYVCTASLAEGSSLCPRQGCSYPKLCCTV